MKRSAIAIGTFDGVHTGHRFLIDRLVRVARREKLKSIIVALSEPVRFVPGLLTTVDEKLRLLRQFPVDEVLLLPSDSALIGQPAQLFFDRFICGRLHAQQMVMGNNFAFGRDREGNIEWLRKKAKEKHVALSTVKPLMYHGKVVSSTLIRESLLAGNLTLVHTLLNRYYSFEGTPRKGRGVGKKLGFPTINLRVDEHKLLMMGVFAGVAGMKGKLYPAAVNIGKRPTFFGKGALFPEVHLLDFNGDWPQERTSVYVLQKLRNEKKFSSISLLQQQIKKDITAAFTIVHRNFNTVEVAG